MALKQTAFIDSGLWALADFYENPVRYSLCYCDYSGKFCITKISENTERKRLYTTLGHFEEMTWKQFSWLPRTDGLSVEKRWDSNYDWLVSEIESYGFKNPTVWHFRYGSNKGRVFGFINSGMLYILKIDAKWERNH